MKVVLLNGTMVGSKTKTLLLEANKHLKNISNEIEIESIDLEQYPVDFADGRGLEDYSEVTQSLIQKLEEADGFIVATPIFQGSIPGSLKNALDLVSPQSMRYKPVALMANGGTVQHHLVIENQLKPVFDYFKCLITPNYVYTDSSQFSHTNELIAEGVKHRIYEMARVFSHYLPMSQAIKEGDHLYS
ncbi:NADPH-dependent FMN reductase [Alkalibacillus salilacus]|uniref:FMN reductase n=1 Tax=Alkalibacillus salilacus TaxID=284582 RepID=A0ABT9VE64_9BACI|nr:NADPH-dependent FMN reductase [Alkalibacillus salilacus]MDQ0159266.1 FMN reductase [Alkalibacillus salilacus]